MLNYAPKLAKTITHPSHGNGGVYEYVPTPLEEFPEFRVVVFHIISGTWIKSPQFSLTYHIRALEIDKVTTSRKEDQKKSNTRNESR